MKTTEQICNDALEGQITIYNGNQKWYSEREIRVAIELISFDYTARLKVLYVDELLKGLFDKDGEMKNDK